MTELGQYAARFTDWRKTLATVPQAARYEVFERAVADVARLIPRGLNRGDAADELTEIATAHGFDPDDVQMIISDIFHTVRDAPPPPREDSETKANGHDAQAARPHIILTLEEWLARMLPEPDYVLGKWLTTTTRALLNASTGLGKTMLGIALGLRMAAGAPFLHWEGTGKPRRILFVDGEMTARGLKRRLVSEVERFKQQPAGFHALCHEDIENFQPLNTPAGQKQIEAVIQRIGGVDFVFFDNIMSLIAGDMKDEESWRQTLPWIKSLSKRSVGQLWLHHTGHDESRGYGSKTREWQMDIVGHCSRLQRPDASVAFKLAFTKARDRTFDTRGGYADVHVFLDSEEAWQHEVVTPESKAPKKLQPLAQKFLDALSEAIGNSTLKLEGHPATTMNDWRLLCVKRGYLGPNEKGGSARSLFSKYRIQLIEAERIVVNGELVRLVQEARGYQGAML